MRFAAPVVGRFERYRRVASGNQQRKVGSNCEVAIGPLPGFPVDRHDAGLYSVVFQQLAPRLPGRVA